MEHFLLPPRVKHLLVPYVCTEEYNGVSFENYPKSKGWTENQLLGDPDFGPRSPEKVEAFFQNWLYFGFLSNVFAILGIKFRTTDFVRKDSKGKLFVTTKKLLRILEAWPNWMNTRMTKHEFENRAPPGTDWRPPKRRSVQISKIFAQVFPWVHRYCNENREQISPLFGEGKRPWPMSEEICMSIIALGQTLADYADHSDDGRGWDFISLGSWGSSHLLTRRMQQAGWCIGDVSLVHADGNIACTYYFGAVPGPRKDRDHSACTKITCKAGSVTVSEYETKHVYDDCNCEHVVARGIEEVISKGVDDPDGAVPLVRWKRSESSGKHELEVLEYSVNDEIRYVAISHV
jgi:hypothetical protein